LACATVTVQAEVGETHNCSSLSLWMLLWVFCRFCLCPIAGWSAAAACTKWLMWTKCRSRQLTRGRFFSSMTCWWWVCSGN